MISAGLAWIALTLGSATAAEPGRVFFETSPDAQVVVFPRVENRTIDIGIYRNRTSIGIQLEDTTARYALSIDAVSVGGGTSYLTIHTDRDDILPRVIRRDGFYEVILAPGRIRVTPPGSPPTLEEIVYPDRPRRPARPPTVPLTPLRGDAATTATDPRAIPMDIPAWRPELDTTTQHGQLLDVDRATWRTIDGYREVLTTTTDPRMKQVARFRLGAAYFTMGHPRESAYYLHNLLEGNDRPLIAVSLVAARADFAIEEWEEGREHCVVAAAAGARRTEVLTCLAAPSLATGVPAPTDVGRSLAIASGAPRHLLLAAQLLQMDHRHAEARPLLEAVVDRLEPEDTRNAQLALGDALYAANEIDAAIAAWSEVNKGDLGEVARLRILMGGLVQEGRMRWASHVPELTRIAEKPSLAGLEAHFLLAQISQVYGNMEDAAWHLNSLWNRDRKLAVDGDVPERLLAVCMKRLQWLDGQQRNVELAAFFADCWRPELDAYLANTHILERVALAHEALGLNDHALRIQLRVMTLHAAEDRDEPIAITDLARLYMNADRPLEALDTIAYGRRHLKPAQMAGPIRLTEARALQATSDDPGAERVWRIATNDPTTRERAHRGLGMLLAELGRCPEAAKHLIDLDDPGVRLSRARCLLAQKRPSGVPAELDPLLASSDPDLRSDASWLASAAAWQDRAPDEPAEHVNGLWKQILDEERLASAFDARLSQFAHDLSPIGTNP